MKRIAVLSTSKRMADGGGEVADQGLDDPEHTERVVRERILRQADRGSHHQSEDWRAAHEREIDRDQQRQLPDKPRY